jgi:anti-sigma B factor antagonist
VDLTFTEAAVGGHAVVAVRGEIDMHSAGKLSERLISRLGPGPAPLIVDLTEVGFIDSTGLGALVAARNQAQESGSVLRVVCPQERLLKLFRITGLDSVFGVFPTVAEAAEAGPTGSLPTAAS